MLLGPGDFWKFDLVELRFGVYLFIYLNYYFIFFFFIWDIWGGVKLVFFFSKCVALTLEHFVWWAVFSFSVSWGGLWLHTDVLKFALF